MEKPVQVGVLCSGLHETTLRPLRYLITYQNLLQRRFEFNLLPCPIGDEFLRTLETCLPTVSAAFVDTQAPLFFQRYPDWVRAQADGFPIDQCDGLVLLSNARLNTNDYWVGEQGWAIIALGGWQREFAPPSIVEYYLSCVVAAGVDFALSRRGPGGARIRTHYATKGCLCDFNANLDDARLGTLTGFLCNDCCSAISDCGSTDLLKDTKMLFERSWLGSPSAPRAAAEVVKKLGYDLFHTTGVKPGFWEGIRSNLSAEVLRTVFQFVNTFLLAAIAFYLGWSVKK